MNKFKKCLSALFLSCFLAFGNVSGCYLEVQAFDWVAPEVYLPFDGAIPYLMGLLGVASDDKVMFSEDAYKQYLLENGFTEEDLQPNGGYQEWVDNVCSGALNQASEYWTKFKEFVKSKVSQTSSGTSSVDSVLGTLGYKVDSFTNDGNIEISAIDTNLSLDSLYCYYGSDSYNNKIHIYYGFDSYVWESSSRNFNIKLTYPDSGTFYHLQFDLSNMTYRIQTLSFSGSRVFVPNSFSFSRDDTFWIYPTSNIGITDFGSLNIISWDISGLQSNFVYNSELIDKLSLILSNAVSTAIPDVIPLPWDEIGDSVDEITDTIDALIEKVNTGVLSIDAYMQRILDLVGAIAVDTSTDLVYPTNPDKPDESIDDKVNENKSNGSFVLSGFEKVFPFCIPFDIYAFMTLLVAEPVAPVIRYPIYNPVTKENNEIVLDFSQWESVTVLFRYIFDFLFIIGLLLSARALIGGGDKA